MNDKTSFNDMCLLINRNNPQLTPRQEAFRDWLENKGLANSTIWNYLSGVGECSHYLCHIMGLEFDFYEESAPVRARKAADVLVNDQGFNAFLTMAGVNHWKTGLNHYLEFLRHV